jgi:putative lipoprotein
MPDSRARLGCAVFAALCLFSSHPVAAHAQDDWLGRDKLWHFSASAGLAGAGYALSSPWLEKPGLRYAAGFSFSLSAGIAKELWDLSGHGDPSLRDLTWDVLGAAVGATLALALDFAFSRGRERCTAAFPGFGFRF